MNEGGDADLDEPDRDADSTSVELPSHIVARLDDRVERTDFESRSEYVAYVLEHVLSRVETDDDRGRTHETVDDEEVEERLESLGYLN